MTEGSGRRHESPGSARGRAARLPCGDRAVHLFALLDEHAQDGPPRRAGRCRRHDAGRAGHVDPAADRPSRIDRGGLDCRRGGRHSAVACFAHGRAPANGPLARVRRTGRGPGRRGEVLSLDGRGTRRTDALSRGGPRHRGDPRFSHAHRQLDGLRQTAGSALDSPAAGHLSLPECHEPRALGARRAFGPVSGRVADRGVRGRRLPADDCLGPGLWRAVGDSDRRGGHADRDFDSRMPTPACRLSPWASCSTTSC